MTKLIKQLTRHEGCPMAGGRAYAYQDSKGLWTIGVGRLIDKSKKAGLTNEECDYLLNNDIKECEAELDAALPWWRALDPVRQRVILDMRFNLGLTTLLTFKNTLAHIQNKKWEEAAKGMLASLWAKQVGVRAVTLAEMMRTGKDPDWLR